MNMKSFEHNAVITEISHFIDHIIEPATLFLAWQSSSEEHRKRYIVAELNYADGKYTLRYLVESKDFKEAQKQGFDFYPAFKDVNKVHDNVLDTFMRRLPPRARGDFSKYLEGLRLKPDVQISDFGLLGYSGAKLLSDGFSIIHPFLDVEGPCELLIEIAGYRHRQKGLEKPPKINSRVTFRKAIYGPDEEDAVEIIAEAGCIGYVSRGLIATFLSWLDENRITEAWIEKTNGTPEKPRLYLFVRVASR
jgi:hypothetical protein